MTSALISYFLNSCTRFCILSLLITTVTLSACKTIADVEKIDLNEVLQNPDINELSFKTSDQGLILVDVDLPNVGIKKFIIDTAATKSAIYQKSLPEFETIGEKGQSVWPSGNNSAQKLSTFGTSLEQIAFSAFQQPKSKVANFPDFGNDLLCTEI